MKKLFLLAVAALSLSSCQDDESMVADSAFQMEATGADYTAACSLPKKTVAGNINANTFWSNDTVYVISGVLRVRNNATLEIEEGTFITADLNAADPTGVLVITRDGQINAHGTAAQPIVFTSPKLLDCTSSGDPQPGDFGGIVILGSSPVNTGLTNNVIEGLDTQPNVSDFYFGGSTPGDDSGTFQYVRIEYAGKDLTGPNSGNEINGLTLGGVGNAGLSAASSKFHHIQITYGLDDGFEWFGGTVNMNYLVSFGQDDDAFDFDLGYTGSVTRALALASSAGPHSDSGTAADSNGIELDNDPNSSGNTPITRPVINYMSIIGLQCNDANQDELENGIHMRRNGRITMTNSVVTGYGQNAITPNTWAIYHQGAGTPFTYFNVGVYACGSGGGYDFTNPASITGVTDAGGANFGMSQPFYDAGPLNFAGATNGAFTGGTIWTTGWTTFPAF